MKSCLIFSCGGDSKDDGCALWLGICQDTLQFRRHSPECFLLGVTKCDERKNSNETPFLITSIMFWKFRVTCVVLSVDYT